MKVGGDRSRGRRAWWLIGSSFVLLVALGGILAWSWWGTYRLGEQAQADVAQVREAVSAGEWEAALQRLPTAAESSSSLAEQTQATPWRVLEAVPGVGATASATRELSVALADVLESAVPLTPFADRILAGDVRDETGALDLSTFSGVAPLLGQLGSVLALGGERLAVLDTAEVREPVASGITDFIALSESYAGAVAQAADVVGRVPAILGSDGARDWLVLLQNPAESRGAGGFPGGYVVMRADRGSLSLAASGSRDDLDSTPIPTDGAPEDATFLWGSELGAWNTYNLSPHFPMTGELSAAGMEARDAPVSGVVALDPAVVAGLMRVTGPVTAMGQTVTPDDVERFFLKDMYQLYPDNAERDAVSLAIVRAVIEGFFSSPWEPISLLDALEGPASEGRLRVWSADASEQEWIETTDLGGVLPDEAGPTVAVAFNNSAGNKMDAFVASSIAYAAGLCAPGEVQSSSLRIVLRNDAPAGLSNESGYYSRGDDPSAPPLSTSLLVHSYLPRDAEVTSATIDGSPLEWYGGDERNHPVAWVKIELERGQERVIEYSFDEPTTVDAEPRIIVQPMATDTVATIVPDSFCG